MLEEERRLKLIHSGTKLHQRYFWLVSKCVFPGPEPTERDGAGFRKKYKGK